MRHLFSYAFAFVLTFSVVGCLSEEPLDENSSFDSTLTESIQSTMSIASVSIDGVALNLQNTASTDAQDITLSPILRIAFSQSLLPATVSAQSVILKKETSVINLSWSVNDKNVTLSPDTILENNTTYTLTFRNTIENTNGAKLYKEYTFSFKTVDESLLVANSIAATHITSGRNAVDTNFSVLFSDAIVIDDATSIRLVNTATSTTTAITTSIIGNKLNIDPVGDLNTSATYEVRILAGAVSKASTRLPLYTTATQTFVISPHARPVATPIAVNIIEPSSAIIVDFGTPLTSSSLDGVSATNAFSKSLGSTTAIRVVPNGLWSEGSLTLSFDTNVTNIDGVSMQTTYTKTLNVNALPYVASTDFNGSTDIRIDRNLTVHFSESMDKESAIVGVTLRNSANAVVAVSGYWDDTNRTLTIDPSADLIIMSNYTLTLANTLTDRTGRALASSYTLSFSANSNARPTISSSSPANGATGAAIDSAVTVTFSEDVNHSVIEAGAVAIENISSTYSWAANSPIVTLTPLGYLSNDTNYTIVITKDVVDASGFGIANEHRYAFRTGTNARPTVATTTMGTAHYIDANFTITFSEAMNPANVITLSGVSIPHTWENNNTQVTLKPASYLSPSTTYVLRVPTSLTDTTGLTLAQEYNYTFTTHSNRAPAVSSRSFSRPAATTTQAAIDSNISVLFDTNVSIADSTKITCVDVNRSANFGISVASNDTTQVRITPSSDWNVSTNYRCTFGAGAVKETVSGILTTQESNVTFTTTPYARPVATLASATTIRPSDAVVVNFGVTLGQTAVIYVSSSATSANYGMTGDSKGLSTTPQGTWAEGELNITFSKAIANLDGVAMLNDYNLSLQVVTPPSVTSVSPDVNATGVEFGAKSIEVRFDRNLYSSLTKCVEVRKDGVPFGEYGDTNGSSIIAINTLTLEANRTYALRVKPDCVYESQNKVAMPNEYVFEFSTIKVASLHTLAGVDSTTSFGWAVDISDNGSTVGITAPNMIQNVYGTDYIVGKVFFFNLANSTNESYYGPITYYGTQTKMGQSIALNSDGSLAMVGAPNFDINYSATFGSHGMYYDWNRTMYSSPTGPVYGPYESGEKLGSALAISDSGNTKVIYSEKTFTGDVCAGDASKECTGRINIKFGGNTYTKYGDLQDTGNGSMGAINGVVSVSGDGKTVIVQGNYAGNGEVRTFDLNDTYNPATLSEKTRLQNITSGTTSYANSLDISDDGLTMVVGYAYGFHPSIASNTGIVEVWTRANRASNWQTKIVLSAPLAYVAYGDQFGSSVSIDGNATTILVGAPQQDINVGGTSYSNAGAVYVFEKNGASWELRERYLALDMGADVAFGTKVDQSDNGKFVISTSSTVSKAYLYEK